MGNVDFGNPEPSETDGLFNITPVDASNVGGDLAANDSPGGPPIDLAEEEQSGGHGISEHVGKSERFLKDRVRDEAGRILQRGEQFEGLGVGSFTSIQSANRLVNSTISQNLNDIEKVVSGQEVSKTITSYFGSPTGYEAYLARAYAEPYMRDLNGVRVVILRDRTTTRGWRVQSAFPVR